MEINYYSPPPFIRRGGSSPLEMKSAVEANNLNLKMMMNWPIWQCLLLLFTIILLIIFLILFLINFRELKDGQNKLSSMINSILETNIKQDDFLIQNGYFSKNNCIGTNESLVFNIYSDYCQGNITNLFPNPSSPYSQYNFIRFKHEIELLLLNNSLTLEITCLPTLTEVVLFLYSTIPPNPYNFTNYLPNMCLFSSNPNVTQAPNVFYPNPPIQSIINAFFNQNLTLYSLENNQKYDAQTIQAKIGRNLLRYENNSIISCFLTEVYCIYELGGPIYVYYASLI